MPYRLYTGTKTRVRNTRDDVGTKGLDEHGSEDGSLHPFWDEVQSTMMGALVQPAE